MSPLNHNPNNTDPSTAILNVIGAVDDSMQQYRSTEDELAELEKRRIIGDNKRGEKYRIHVYIIVVVGMYLVGACILFAIVCKALHLMLPTNYQWLCEEQKSEIDRILFGSIFLTLAGNYFKQFNLLGKQS